MADLPGKALAQELADESLAESRTTPIEDDLPAPIRIAALNLGPKIVEFAWMEALAEVTCDPALKQTFAGAAVA
jgi:hypothetical protein